MGRAGESDSTSDAVQIRNLGAVSLNWMWVLPDGTPFSASPISGENDADVTIGLLSLGYCACAHEQECMFSRRRATISWFPHARAARRPSS